MRVFQEVQAFDQWWFRILMLAVACITVGSVVMVYPELDEDPTAFWASLLTATFSLILIATLLFYVKLETKINEKGIHYKFWPVHLNLKLISWNEIESCEVRHYNPIMDYGGWGYKFISFRKRGTSLSIKGNIGIQIVFKTGKELLIGTQKEEEVKQVLHTYKHKLQPYEH